MGRAESLLHPPPGYKRPEGKPLTQAQVLASLRKDAKELLAPYARKAQKQRGLTRDLARIKMD